MKKQMKQVVLVTSVISCLALGAIGCGGGGTAGGGSGGSTGSALCTPTIAMDAVVSNFSSGSGVLPSQGRTGGWYVYFDGDSNASSPNNQEGVLDPRKSSGAPPPDTMTGGPCSGAGSFRQKATGLMGWGYGLGTDLAAKTAAGKKGFYNAMADGYAGVGIWIKCAMATMHVSVKLPNGDTDFDAPSPMCTSYANCNAHGKYNQMVGTDWELFKVPFAEAMQDSGAMGTSAAPPFNPATMTGIQLQINANYDMAGASSPNNFECWFDDVHFYK